MPWVWWAWRSQNGKRLAPTSGPQPPRLTTRLKSSTFVPNGNACACWPPSVCNRTLKTALPLRGSYLSPGRTAALPIKTEKPLASLNLWVRRRHASGFCICWARGSGSIGSYSSICHRWLSRSLNYRPGPWPC